MLAEMFFFWGNEVANMENMQRAQPSHVCLQCSDCMRFIALVVLSVFVLAKHPLRKTTPKLITHEHTNDGHANVVMHRMQYAIT